jgi:hypothetical protein
LGKRNVKKELNSPKKKKTICAERVAEKVIEDVRDLSWAAEGNGRWLATEQQAAVGSNTLN